MMADSGLRPLRLREGEGGIAERAIERARGGAEMGPEGGRRKRREFPSDRARRERAITVVLPDRGDVEYLKAEAGRINQERMAAGSGEEFTTTRLATLLLEAALGLWRDGKLEIKKEQSAVERIVVRPVQEKRSRG